MTKTHTLLAVPLAAVALLAGGATVAYTGLASAQTTPPTGTTTTAPQGEHRGMGHMFGKGMGRGVEGTVSAINGTTLTITKSDGTSYTVDASQAQVTKISALAVSDIKVGDTLGVMGTVSGTSVTAKHIMDGIPPHPEAPPTQQ